MKIKVAKDFSKTPGARFKNDGSNSGEEFYEKILKPKYIEALKKKEKLSVDLDGTHGYASSFLNEAFGRLSNECLNNGKFDPDFILRNIEIISFEIPDYRDDAMKAIREERNK